MPTQVACNQSGNKNNQCLTKQHTPLPILPLHSGLTLVKATTYLGHLHNKVISNVYGSILFGLSPFVL